MTFLLAMAVVVLFVLLHDARSQLRQVQRRLAALEARPAPPPEQARDGEPAPAVAERTPARVVARAEPIAAAAPPLAAPPPIEPAPPPVEPAKPRESLPAAAAAPRPARQPLPRIGFEELFGRRLPIWAGGITLAVAGILLVKYSIDLGLLSPAVRVALGLAFGTALIAGAEAALRQASRVGDPRVAQALAGAGVSSLFASIVAAANLYGLIGPAAAFVGLAAVTALAMAMALRFGAPSALLGLVGGLAAPALVQSGAPNVPLLSAYLALTVSGLAGLSLRRRWAWLGLGAMLGGAGWSLLLIVSGALDALSTLSVGVLVAAFGLGAPMLAFAGPRAALVRTGAAVVAAAQMALLVGQGGFGPLQWGLFGLLSAALLWLVGRERELRTAAAVGLALALLLAAMWPAPPLGQFVAVITGVTALYGGAALLRLWRPGSGVLEAGALAAVALGGLAAGLIHFRLDDGSRDGALALLALLAAALPAAGAVLGWRREARRGDARFALLATAVAVLVALAAALGLPDWLLPLVLVLLAAGLVELARAAADRRIEAPAAAFLMAAVLAAAALGPLARWSYAAGQSLYGVPLLVTALPAPVDAVRVLLLPALAAAAVLLLRRGQLDLRARIAGSALVLVLAVPGAHVLYKQLFAIVGPVGFVRFGLIERTLWEGLIVLAAAAAWRLSLPRAATALAAAALAHFAWYSVALHDPLWAEQATGPVPLANALTAAAAVALAALWLLERTLPATLPAALRPAPAVAAARMLVILWLGVTSLRQLFAGSPFARAPVGAGESIAWSVTAIVIALAFLVWGIRARSRVWRIGSLALMLVAVAKVFLIDAAGLEGLLRIASFLALGFSLIGLGWLYSRFLRSDPEPG